MLEIIDNRKVTTSIKDLKPGDTFIYDGCPCIMVDEQKSKYIIDEEKIKGYPYVFLNLENNTLKALNDNAHVTPMKMKLMINSY